MPHAGLREARRFIVKVDTFVLLAPIVVVKVHASALLQDCDGAAKSEGALPTAVYSRNSTYEQLIIPDVHNT